MKKLISIIYERIFVINEKEIVINYMESRLFGFFDIENDK